MRDLPLVFSLMAVDENTLIMDRVLILYSILGAMVIAVLGGLVGFCGGGLIAALAGFNGRQRRGSFALGASVLLAVLTFFSALMALASCLLMKI